MSICLKSQENAAEKEKIFLCRRLIFCRIMYMLEAKFLATKENKMLRDDLQKALKEAMLAKDTLTTSAVRMIIAGQKEKDVEARGKGQEKATDAELLSMMQGMIKQRNDSIKMFIDGNRPELADKEKAEIAVIERFLPKQMSPAETEAAVKAVIAETGAASMKDMGKVMGGLKAKYAGQMDFGKVNGLVKTLLGGN